MTKLLLDMRTMIPQCPLIGHHVGGHQPPKIQKMSYETNYAAKKRQQFDARASTPEAAKARAELQALFEEVDAKCRARFPSVETTADLAAWEAYRTELFRRAGQ